MALSQTHLAGQGQSPMHHLSLPIFFAITAASVDSAVIPLNPRDVSGTSLDSISNMSRFPEFARATTTADTASSSKFVVAHFIVGNCAPYTVETWKKDIILALNHGIDGFALNLGYKGSDSDTAWQERQIAHAFDAGKGTEFKFFFSFDMAEMPCKTSADATLIQQFLKKYLHHPNYLKYRFKRLVSTFSGEGCTFGSTLNDGWEATVKKGFEDVYFVPGFIGDPKNFAELDVVDGLFSWDSSWPRDNDKPSFIPDQAYTTALRAKTYMAPVSPWFFTHYGEDSYDKNLVYNFDNWLLATRWEILIENSEYIDIIQILSWNDYGESHYIAPIEGSQPDSQEWTKGFPHSGWLDLSEYYAKTFKGKRAPIVKDQLFLWSRLYREAAEAKSDSVGKPEDAHVVDDTLWAVALLKEAAMVTIICGTAEKKVKCRAGVCKVKLVFPKSGTCKVKASTSSGIELDPEGYTFGTTPDSYNFNAFVAASK